MGWGTDNMASVQEMSWWVSSLDLESTRKYNLAARRLLRQTGVVRQRGEEFTPQELEYKPAEVGFDPQTEEEIVLVEEDLLYGLALDSACNRTVTGAVWLYGFLEKLKEAPEEIRSLVKREGEHEMFRFGNGGVQRSFERWRLPMVVGQSLIIFLDFSGGCILPWSFAWS